ncbi:hypothetical protein VTN49DRAFT_2154 [Thermomyces lanuginosus]|uniref:uncharacterized protein n=1 Tax=Thermomyces lanuginosus TaxID=5541 RepID=UPI00374369AD
MISTKATGIFRENARLRQNSDKLAAEERERLVKPYLPDPKALRRQRSTKARKKKTPIRSFLSSRLHLLLYTLIHLFYGLYLRIYQTFAAVADRVLAIIYYHHRTPELIQKDVKVLSRLPEHLSVLLRLRKEEDALHTLMDEVSELAAWSSCAGIPVLSVYERTGILKTCIPTLYHVVTEKLASYHGSPSHQPNLRIFAPNQSAYSPSVSPSAARRSNNPTLTILLLSASDGRETLVDLTKTLTEMSQNGKLSPADITLELVDAEISDITTRPSQSTPAGLDLDPANGNDGSASTDDIFPPVKPEPDLLIVFAPTLKLDGYPPWQIRLTEIFCTGDKGSAITSGSEDVRVEYHNFLQALWKYARAQFRLGR